MILRLLYWDDLELILAKCRVYIGVPCGLQGVYTDYIERGSVGLREEVSGRSYSVCFWGGLGQLKVQKSTLSTSLHSELKYPG